MLFYLSPSLSRARSKSADREAAHAEEQGLDGKGPRTSLY